MLTYEQLRHFAEHGWVLEENLLSPEQIEAYKTALERQSQYVRPLAHEDNDEIVHIDCMVNGDPLFPRVAHDPTGVGGESPIDGRRDQVRDMPRHDQTAPQRAPHPARPLARTGQDGLASRYAPQVGHLPPRHRRGPGQLRISQQHYLPDRCRARRRRNHDSGRLAQTRGDL